MPLADDYTTAPSAGKEPRFALSPEWFLTPTGIGAVILGILAVVTQILTVVGGFPEENEKAAVGLVGLIAAVFGFVPALRIGRERRFRRPLRIAWGLVAGSLAVIGLGSALHVLSLLGRPDLHEHAHRALIGLGLVANMLVLAALIWMPAGPLARRFWVSGVLDVVTLGLAGFVGFWIYSIAPVGTTPVARGVPLLVIMAHAILAMAMAAVSLLLYLRPRDAFVRKGFYPLVVGVSFLVVLEVGPLCTAIHLEGFVAEPPLAGWSLFALAVAVAARGIQHHAPVMQAAQMPARVQIGIPFASTVLVGFLLSTSLISPELWQEQIAVLLPATFIALALIVTRQTLTARDNLRLAEEMQKAKEVAESANSARLQFLANISHDLRTPLNGVLGCAQILLRDKSISPKQRELIKTMQGSAEHLRNLINDLLDLSKLEADKLELAPTAFDLRAFLDDLVKAFSLEAEKKKLVLELRSSEPLPGWITCDRKRLQQILGNLVHNAIKFTDRGSVLVRVQVGGADLVFDVTDTGCGIMPDKVGELFQPFHVVDQRSIKLEGTGLGLSICKKLAQRMGGDITVHSVVSRGSTFTVHIPLKESAPVVEVQRTIVDYQGRRRRILIVDDQPANRVVLRTMLEPLDFLVDEAPDAEAALNQVRFARPDVILLDLMMPGVDGFGLLQQINELSLTSMPPCLAISALSGDEIERKCRDAGFRQLLNKPVNFELLTEALHTHAGIEWTYGVIQPAPVEPDSTKSGPARLSALPPAAEIAAFLDLARRGFVRNLETRAEQLANHQPEYAGFADRVRRHARLFELKELAEWLTSISTENPHGST